MAFTDAQKIQIRRHLGYPIYGLPLASPYSGVTLGAGFVGYRFHQAYGLLEYRMNNMQPAESAVITGFAVAMVVLSANPNGPVGQGLTVSIRIVIDELSLDETVSVESSTTDTVYSLAQALASGIMANPVLGNAGFHSVSPLGQADFGTAQPPGVQQPFPSLQISAPLEYRLTVTSAAPIILSCPEGGGFFRDPRIVIEDEKFYGYLPILGKLEEMVGTVAENLDTERADVWTSRVDELDERRNLYKVWRLKLATFFDIPLYEDTGYSVVEAKRGKRSLVA